MNKLNDYIEFFKIKSNFQITEKDFKNNIFLYNENNGFCLYEIKNNILIITKCCGNGSYWINKIINIALNQNISIIKLLTYKNPKVVIRKYKLKKLKNTNEYLYNKKYKVKIISMGLLKNNKNGYLYLIYL